MGRFRSGYRQPSSLLYVGSTAVGAAKRHLNRMAVYRRLQRTEFVDAELSLRYWASQHNLFQFVLVPLEFCDSYQRAWTVEHELIAQWQAPLNYPRAMSLIKKTALGFRISSKHRGSLYCTFGLRLWRKLRKRMFGRSSKFFIHDSRELAWGLLFKLASRTRASFETAKLLRSNKTADEEVYALIKLSRNIENPHRNRVQGILKGVAKFRKKMHWPRTSRPLGVLPTASPSFSKECEKWLKDLILRYKYLFPSFHVPKNSLREVPHLSIKKFLHNFRSWEETMWEHDFDLESVHCPCEQFAGKLPAHCFVSGHVATGLENLTKLLPGCSSILSASAASTFFPGRNHWMAKSRALFDQWLKRHKLPATLHPIFQSFCDHQWQQHVAALEQSDRLHWALVQKVKSALHSDFVLYNEDHHPNHVLCYCPRFFLRGVSTTWNDPSVFRTLDGTPEEWRQRILERVPRDLSRRYAWAFKETAPLPQGTVFLKRKKQFAKGRTIISYSNSLCSKLLELTSIALTLMVKTLFADSPGMQSMPQLWRSLHAYWAKPSQEEDVEWNDDLVGFFNAVPRKDIMHAVHLIVQEYCQTSGCSILSIDMLSKTGHPGKPRGRTKSNLKRCWVSDVPLIVDLSFATGVFTAAGKCRQQVEGTCIGNQISPILSGLPVLLAERQFLQSLPTAIQSSFLFLRYVDNRLILGPQKILLSSQLRRFCDPNFYDGIQLETVSDHQWLGLTICAKTRSATFNLPEQPWQIRSPNSAGSWQLAASGYFSRASLIRQYSWPPESRPGQLRRLKQLYVQEYFNPEPWPSNTIFTSTEDPLECRLQADRNLRLQFFRLLRKLAELGRFRYTHHLELRFQFNSHRGSRPSLLTPAVSVMIAVARDDDGVDIIGMNVTLRDLPRPQFDQFCLPLSLLLDHQQGPILENKEPVAAAVSPEFHKNTSPKTPPKNPAPKSPVPPAQSGLISVDEEQLFHAAHRSSYEQLREQITARAKGRNAVDFYEEGMSSLLAYMFFVLHYHENFLTTEGLHTWPIIPHSHMRRFTDRITFTRQRSLPVSKILKEDVEDVLKFLLTRFGQADRPFLPVIPIGQREIVTLARSILASKIPYKAIFQHDAKAYAMPQEALHVWEFPVAHMPGPEEQTNCYYLWGHGTTAEGLVGILTLGRVIRSSAEAVHVAPHDHVCSFYGKATQNVYYEESKLDFVSKLHHSTKNSAGVVVGGYLGSAHHKSKSSSTVHEGHLCKFHPLVHSPSGDKRWAVREAAGRIDKIWILSSTHSITLPMSTPNNPRPITFETGEGQDWGVSWPGLEYSVRSTEALPVSDVQREA
ncbi:unnamed protein product [Symbiodinium sp. CCMP2592]|nr:unnamed protein product [Symbiodinium sp. CCMP2592]